MDRYENDFEKYIQSKFRITKNQKSEDILIYNYDDENIRNKIKTQKNSILVCIKHLMRTFYKDEQINININKNKMTIQELALQGKYNVYNSMAASAAQEY